MTQKFLSVRKFPFGVVTPISTNLKIFPTKKQLVSDSIGRGGRIISESGAALIGVGIVRTESCENCRAARKFPHELCYAEAE